MLDSDTLKLAAANDAALHYGRLIALRHWGSRKEAIAVVRCGNRASAHGRCEMILTW